MSTNKIPKGYITLQPYIWKAYLEEAIEGAEIWLKKAQEEAKEAELRIAKHIYDKKRMFWQRQPTMDECIKKSRSYDYMFWTMVEDAAVMRAHSFILELKTELTGAVLTRTYKETKDYHIGIEWYNTILRYGRRFREAEKRRLEAETDVQHN